MRSIIVFVLRLAALGMLAAVGCALYARSRLTSSGEPDSDSIELVGIFGGFEFESRATAFRGGTLLAWFGGGTLDLRNATLAPEGARLTVHALFGGAQVVVPDGWDIDRRLIGIAGGLGDDRPDHAHPHTHERPVLTIDGWAAFGGVGVSAERRGPAAG